MLKSLFNGSVLLVVAGFILICSSSPEASKVAISQFVDRLGEFTVKHGTSFIPNYYASFNCEACQAYPYQISLVGMSDYYNTIPTYGTLIR